MASDQGFYVVQPSEAHSPEATFTTHVNDCALTPLTIVSIGAEAGEPPGIRLDAGQYRANKKSKGCSHTRGSMELVEDVICHQPFLS